ncbi:MAG: FecR domain-containing protein [Akkermansiaceae bacterium]|nr:FecR domain-containing protein [Akkermansiaceae bacterium]
MTPFSNDPDFLDLIAVWHQNREFSDERKAELRERLESDPKLRRELAGEVQMAALTGTVQRGESSWLRLEEKFSIEEESDTLPPHEDAIMSRIRGLDSTTPSKTPTRIRQPRNWRNWWLGTAAAAAVLVLGLALILQDGTDSLPSEEASVATVIRIDGSGRTSQGRTLSVGDLLRAGEKLSMTQGLVEMSFLDTGVHVIASAPLELTAESTKRMFVHDGEVKLHVPPQGIGFVVETLERKITDLGTSFVVTAGENGSEVLVLDGQIAVADWNGGAEKLMFEGDQANFDRDGAVDLHLGGFSGVPERQTPQGRLGPASLRGRLIAFEPSPSTRSPNTDFIGARVLPLIRSGFQNESCLEGLKQLDPIRFAGIAGTYNNFPRTAGLEPYNVQLGWLAWYRGKCASPEPGRYRFWGYADNHLLVAVNGEPVFEGSRTPFALPEGLQVERRDHPSLPLLNNGLGFASGEWFEVGTDPVQLDLLFGEEWGNLTSGLLLIEREGETYEETSWGQPKWPLFLTEPLSETEINELKSLRNHMEDNLKGSFSISSEAAWNVQP